MSVMLGCYKVEICVILLSFGGFLVCSFLVLRFWCLI